MQKPLNVYVTDFETLGLGHGAPILQVAIVWLQRTDGEFCVREQLHLGIRDEHDQAVAGKTPEVGIVLWWGKQDAKMQLAPGDEVVPLDVRVAVPYWHEMHLAAKLERCLEHWGHQHLDPNVHWASWRPIDFFWMQNFQNVSYRNWSDIASLWNWTFPDRERPGNGAAHDALADAEWAAQRLIEVADELWGRV
jgi:hypothetical protein